MGRAADQGCAYCHNTDNLSDDGIYAKKVARRMLQMTRHINTDWKAHVANTGVVCWTCHRGNPVPTNVWYQDTGFPQAGGFCDDATTASAIRRRRTAPPRCRRIRTARCSTRPASSACMATTALPKEGFGAPIMQTEKTYSLMIAMSNGLGVNCTFCHNTRQFSDWSESPPQRVTAWHGIQMVRDLNGDYLGPLKDVYPATRLGPAGDAPKAELRHLPSGREQAAPRREPC